MKSFLQRFGSFVSGVLHGFDRLRLRGSKRLLCTPGGVSSFLSQVGVPFLDDRSYAKETTLALCKSIQTQAKQADLYQYLNNCQVSKEEVALRRAADQKREQGLIAWFPFTMHVGINGRDWLARQMTKPEHRKAT